MPVKTVRDAAKTQEAEELPPPQPRRRVLRIAYSPDESARGRMFDLDGKGPIVFGRAVEGPGCLADGRVSREHAVVRPESAGGYSVADLGARNGTYLQGRRLERAQPLLSGQVLAIGDTLLVVDQEPELDALPAAPEVTGTEVIECIGVSFASERLRRSIATVASTNTPALIFGETGCGKEIAASAIHRLSGRDHMVSVNCSGIPQERAEAELFGWKKGSFPGAFADHEGYFGQAANGTLFLDEIADLPAGLQASLLRALQDGSIQPVGGTPKRVEVRVIAATHKELGGTSFRKDLLARLSDWILNIPPLRERRADILVLWEHFERRKNGGAAPRPMTALYAEALLLYGWPMNVRELEKLAGTQSVLAKGAARFEPIHLPQNLVQSIRDRVDGSKSGAVPIPASTPVATMPPLEEAESEPDERTPRPEKDVVLAQLERHGGNLQKTAKANGWHRTQLYRWVRYYQIDLESLRPKT